MSHQVSFPSLHCLQGRQNAVGKEVLDKHFGLHVMATGDEYLHSWRGEGLAGISFSPSAC